MRLKLMAAAIAGAAALVLASGDLAQASNGRLTLVFVLDGLRPDAISREETPNLYRLREEGVNFVNSHSAVPTVTRVNSAVIGTGSHPGTNGIVGNEMYVPEVDPRRAFSTGEADKLTRLDQVTGGRMILVDSLGERLAARGKRLVALGSGTSGGTLLLNPRAPRGVGTMINAGDVSAARPFAYPTAIGEHVLGRFGRPPTTSGTAKVDYAEQLLRDYVLPELRPDVVLNWLTEPDGSQHARGAGSPEARATIRNDDAQIGLVLQRLGELGLAAQTNILVTSDHGFSLHDFNVNITQELIAAGLKASADSDDVVAASSGTVLLHVKDRDPHRIRAIVRFLQRQPWADTIFTAAGRRDDAYGWVPGTFSLELIHQANAERGADIVLTLPWSSRKNAFGVPGRSATSGGGATGPRTGPESGHGSFSPWDIRNTLLAWGADFKDGVTARAPAGNVDIAPTILALNGIRGRTDGRVLAEAFEDGPDEETVDGDSRVLRTSADGGRYRAAIRISELEDGRYRYIDKSWRLR